MINLLLDLGKKLRFLTLLSFPAEKNIHYITHYSFNRYLYYK